MQHKAIALCSLLLAALPVSAQNLIINPDFAGNLNSWGTFGATGQTNFFGENVEAAFFSDNTGNNGGLFQVGIAATPGYEYTFDILRMRIETNTNAVIRYGLEFHDASDNNLLSEVLVSLDLGLAARNDNSFSPTSLTATAPAGAAFVRPMVRYSDTVGGSNFFYVFDTSLTVSAIPEPGTAAALVGATALALVAYRRRAKR